MHDTRMRGFGPYFWKVYLRKKGLDKTDTLPADSIIVKTTRNDEHAARGRAQIELDNDYMVHYYPAEVEKFYPLGHGGKR